MNEITNYKQKVDRLYELKQEIATLEQEQKDLKTQIMAMLDKEDLDNFSGTKAEVSLVVKESVATPKAITAKEQFFNWLQEKNLYWELITVNTNSLNALYRSEKELDENAIIPGIGEPYSRLSLQLRKK